MATQPEDQVSQLSIHASYHVGDLVILNVPENPTLHRTRAKVRELTEWGAHLFAEAAKTLQFRALYEEMEPLHRANGEMSSAVEMGYTGDVCPSCGGLRMKRSGTCTTCEDCGSTSGCG